MEIKDVIENLIELGHGTTLSKKQLIDMFKKEFLDLKKTRIDLFVKECFEKQRRPLDSKVSDNNFNSNLLILEEAICEGRCSRKVWRVFRFPSKHAINS